MSDSTTAEGLNFTSGNARSYVKEVGDTKIQFQLFDDAIDGSTFQVSAVTFVWKAVY